MLLHLTTFLFNQILTVGKIWYLLGLNNMLHFK